MADYLPTSQLYLKRSGEVGEWLKSSIRRGGGSAAYRVPGIWWGAPYPETTGYLIPTFLELNRRFPGGGYCAIAEKAAAWLLEIQMEAGSWPGGLYHQRGPRRASIFNTGQILTGMIALFDKTGEHTFLQAAEKGSQWMASQVDASGSWPAGDYSVSSMPSYYSHAAAPMLRVWQRTQDESVRIAAESILRVIINRRRPNGAFDAWGFNAAALAPTHTIAYTLWGFLEAADILDDRSWAEPALAAIETLVRRTEFSGGRLPGSFDTDWKRGTSTVCLTGNAQLALCILELDRHLPDLRLVNAAAKLMDFVSVARFAPTAKGVPGSWPIWGPYMRFRFPNWSAKYTCDALFRLIDRLDAEGQMR